MSITADPRVRELNQMRLALRSDLVLIPQGSGDSFFCVVEDPLTTKMFRIGRREYRFWKMLDGRATVGDCVRQMVNERRGSETEAFTEDEAARVIGWLLDQGLATSQAQRAGEPSHQPTQSSTASKTHVPFNPLMIRIPFGCPDRFFAMLTRRTSWLFAWPAQTVMFLFTVSAAIPLLSHHNKLAAASRGLIAPGNWLAMGIIWLTLKIVHEAAHGIVCQRYGGRVREAGLTLLFFAPLAYVDVTAAWRFRSKWQRLHTAAAGMLVELFLAAIAAWVWSATSLGRINHCAFCTMLMASVTTLLFNANPLMKFDGYFMLSDVCAIPNLAAEAQQQVRGWLQWLFLGWRRSKSACSQGHRGLLILYGVLAWGWRCTVTVTLLAALSVMFHGAGLALLVAGIAVSVVAMLVRLWKTWEGGYCRRIRWTRLGLVSSTVTAALTTLFVAVPWPFSQAAPVIVEYSPLTVVRATSPGWVKELHVQAGEEVQTGQVLVVLNNPMLEFELANLTLEIAQAQLKARGLQQEAKRAAYQAQQKQIEMLQARRQEKQSEVEQLTIRAPVAGKVLGRNLAQFQETYIPAGRELLMVGDESQKEIRTAIRQEAFATFSRHVDQPVHIALRDGAYFDCRLTTVDPRATTQVPHDALAATNGGPLSVREIASPDSTQSQTDVTHELLTPHFAGSIQLDPHTSQSIRAGQVGTISFHDDQDRFGGHLYRTVEQWFRAKLKFLAHS